MRTFSHDQMVYSHNSPFNFFTNGYHVLRGSIKLSKIFRKFTPLMEALITLQKIMPFHSDLCIAKIFIIFLMFNFNFIEKNYNYQL